MLARKKSKSEVENGGLALIRVRDDGAGITQADLPLAVARHATSKIASLHDLERVREPGVSRRGAAQHCLGFAFSLTHVQRGMRTAGNSPATESCAIQQCRRRMLSHDG